MECPFIYLQEKGMLHVSLIKLLEFPTQLHLHVYVLIPGREEQGRPGCDLSHLALARYHLVAHPGDPTRLTRIFVTLNSVSTAAVKEDVAAVFFGNEIGVVNFFVNNVLLHS